MSDFTFVTGIAQQRLDRLTGDGLSYRLVELAVIGLRPAIDKRRKDQMRTRIADG
jgi:hypothetical protein